MKRRSGERSPSEWSPGTKSSEPPSWSSAGLPMRVIRRMFATTYALWVISSPTLLKGDPSGPIT